MISLLRIIKFSLQDIGRNLGMSFMTVFILLLMLLSVNVLLAVDVLTKESVNLIKDQINVSIYFSPTAADKDVEAVGKDITAFPEVVDLKTITRDDALRLFRERHRLNKEVLQALDELGSNPFGPTMVIRTQSPDDYKKIIAAISIPKYESIIEAKSYDEHSMAIDKIQNITGRIEQVGLGLSLLFALISFLVIFNTIRVAINGQRVEIGIKRLVGADSWFIRGPYIVESLIYTFVSILLTIGVIYFALQWVDPYLSVVFPNGFSLTSYYNLHILYVFAPQFLAVLVLTVVSSSLAMRKQLKV